MSLEKFLDVNMRVDVRREDEKKIYRSIIQGAMVQQYFSIQVPTSGGSVLHLFPGERAWVSTIGEGEQYSFTTTVRGRSKDRVPLYILDWPDEVHRTQQRGFVRIKAILEVFYQEIQLENLDSLAELRPRERALTSDISGGGLSLICRQAFPPGKLLVVEVVLPVGDRRQVLKLAAQVTRCRQVQGDVKNRYQVGLVYKNITEREQDQIVAYVFRRQLEERRR